MLKAGESLPFCFCSAEVDGIRTTVKGHMYVRGYKVVSDDKINPGRYGFGIIHDVNKPLAFSRRGCCAPWLDEVANEGYH